MRHLFGFLCVCALGLMPLVGCETADNGGTGGTAGGGGSAGDGGTAGGGGSAGDGGSGGAVPCTRDEECEDNDVCIDHFCDDEDFVCVYVPIECWDDLNDCTTDACNPATFCEYTPAADGTPCAGGVCQAGHCELAGSIVPCTEQGIRNAVAAGGGPYKFDCDGLQTIVTERPIDIVKDVILDGESKLTLEYHGHDGLFKVKPGEGESANVQLTGFVITTEGFDIDTCDWGINNSGTLAISDVTVTEYCLGVFNDGTLSMANATVSENGAGIANEGTLIVANSTVSENIYGPAIANMESGTATLTHCTLSGSEYERSVVNSGTLTVTGTLLAGDCEGDITSNGYNIESPGDTCGFDQTGDQPSVTEVQLNLGELANNGGPTMTHKPGAGGLDDGTSVAIDHIPGDACDLTKDQRGQPRPEMGGTMCDVGAFEVQP